jgi:hypothetical protein
MIKLTNILSEIKVNNPANAIVDKITNYIQTNDQWAGEESTKEQHEKFMNILEKYGHVWRVGNMWHSTLNLFDWIKTLPSSKLTNLYRDLKQI